MLFAQPASWILHSSISGGGGGGGGSGGGGDSGGSGGSCNSSSCRGSVSTRGGSK